MHPPIPDAQKKVTQEEADKALRRIVKSRTGLIFDKPVLAPLLFKLEPKRIPFGTIATDGKSLLYNPAFVNNLEVKFLKFALLHETLHCCFKHPSRRGTREPQIWNIAADLVINGILVYDEKTEAPDWICVDKKYHKTEWEKEHPDIPITAETVYDELYKNAEHVKVKFKITCPCIQKDPTEGAGEGEGQGGSSKDGKGCSHGNDPESGGEKPEKGWDAKWDKGLEEEWKQAVIAAEQMARMRGDAPGWMTSLVDDIVEPKVPLDKILLKYIGTVISDETSWKSPNRRFVSRGIYLPSSVVDKKDGVIVIDTSGSISDEEALDFLGIAAKVLRSKGINEVRLMQCDVTITDDIKFRRVGDFKSHVKKVGVKGRGGTSFTEPFEKLEKERSWNVAFLMYLTDLCGTFPRKAPKFPVIWVSTTEDAAPFGTTIYWDRKSDKIKIMKGKAHAEKA